MDIFRIRDWDKHYENNRTRELKKLEWVPVPNRMDGAGYNELVDHPNGAAHLGAWLAILEIASRCRVRGTLAKEDLGTVPQEGAAQCGEVPITAKDLARMSRLPQSLFEEVMPRLLSIGWVEVFKNLRSVTLSQEGAERCGTDARARSVLFSSVLSSSGGAGGDFVLSPSTIKIEKLQERWFAQWFWPARWRNEGKKEALASWKKKATSEERAKSIVEAEARQKPQYLRRDTDKRPHMSTWLNQDRFDDEVEVFETGNGREHQSDSAPSRINEKRIFTAAEIERMRTDEDPNIRAIGEELFNEIENGSKSIAS